MDKFNGHYPYDKQETFRFADGGHIFIHFKGKSFIEETRSSNLRPLLFIVPGLTSHYQHQYVRRSVDTAYKRGYDVVVINYRGLAGARLTSPKLYQSGCHLDVL